MPSLGADMEFGTLVEWLKKPGDAIRRGDVVAVVETQKGAIEVEVFVNGTMGKPLVPLGTKVPVGTVLAMIEDAPGQRPPAAPVLRPPASPVAARPGEAAPLAPITGLRISPAARKAAETRGIDLRSLKGTGPEGAITLRDVEQAAAPGAKPAIGLDIAKMREAIAAAMAHSKREIPHYYLATDIDMTHALEWLETGNMNLPPAERLLPTVLMVRAVARACRKFGVFNGFYTPSGFAPREDIHIGVAIALRGGGLVAPAIHDCDQLGLDALMAKLRDLVARARVGRLRSSEISDPTITVSSLGERGVDSLFGIIYPPQVAIVGFGKIAGRPAASGDEIKLRPLVTATLAADHRASDGHLGGLFLAEISDLLQEPERL